MYRKRFCISIWLLAAFILWTAAVMNVDVQAIGPEGSTVGFAAMNRYVHSRIGVHLFLYTLTDWLSLIPLIFALCFALLGLSQWIRRKKLLLVDRSILILGGLYAVTAAAYVFFEKFAVNYRPVLIDGILEASYPSSTTLLVLSIMPAAAMQLHQRIRCPILRRAIEGGIAFFSVFMVAARLLSGVHWITDIAGSILLSAGLVTLYSSIATAPETNA